MEKKEKKKKAIEALKNRPQMNAPQNKNQSEAKNTVFHTYLWSEDSSQPHYFLAQNTHFFFTGDKWPKKRIKCNAGLHTYRYLKTWANHITSYSKTHVVFFLFFTGDNW